jgi:hypothetical protein
VSLAGILSAVKLKYIRGLDWPGQSNPLFCISGKYI